MKMKNLILGLLISILPIASYTSCSVPDNSAAVLVLEDVRVEVKDVLDSFQTVVSSATMDEGLKTQILQAIEDTRSKVNEELDLVITDLVASGKLDPTKIGQELFDTIQDLVKKYKELKKSLQ